MVRRDLAFWPAGRKLIVDVAATCLEAYPAVPADAVISAREYERAERVRASLTQRAIASIKSRDLSADEQHRQVERLRGEIAARGPAIDNREAARAVRIGRDLAERLIQAVSDSDIAREHERTVILTAARSLRLKLKDRQSDGGANAAMGDRAN